MCSCLRPFKLANVDIWCKLGQMQLLTRLNHSTTIQIFSLPKESRGNMNEANSKHDERRAFLFLTVILAPLLSVIIVGGYGFLVWILQIIGGPPTS